MTEPDSYFKLVRNFPLRPIRDEAEYDAAVAVMEKLAISGEGSLDPEESDHLDALSTFISRYDDEKLPLQTTIASRMSDWRHWFASIGSLMPTWRVSCHSVDQWQARAPKGTPPQ